MGSMSGSPSPVHWGVQPIQDLPADPAVRRIQEARHCVASPILRPSARTPGGSHRGTPRPTRMAPLLEVTKVIEHHEMSKRRKVGSLFNFTSTCACSIRTARAQRTPLRVGRATRLAERARRSRPVPLYLVATEDGKKIAPSTAKSFCHAHTCVPSVRRTLLYCACRWGGMFSSVTGRFGPYVRKPKCQVCTGTSYHQH